MWVAAEERGVGPKEHTNAISPQNTRRPIGIQTGGTKGSLFRSTRLSLGRARGKGGLVQRPFRRRKKSASAVFRTEQNRSADPITGQSGAPRTCVSADGPTMWRGGACSAFGSCPGICPHLPGQRGGGGACVQNPSGCVPYQRTSGSSRPTTTLPSGSEASLSRARAHHHAPGHPGCIDWGGVGHAFLRRMEQGLRETACHKCSSASFHSLDNQSWPEGGWVGRA